MKFNLMTIHRYYDVNKKKTDTIAVLDFDIKRI